MSILLRVRLSILVLGCVCFWGCATYNAATGRSEFIIIPTSEEVAMGKSIHQKLVNEFSLSARQDQVRRLERIGRKLALMSDRQDYQYHFYLIEKDDLNAFTTPGGNIYFFTGLLDRLSDDAEIASVLAHEIGHCAAKHTIKKFQAAITYDLIGGIVLGQLAAKEQVQRITALSTNAIMSLVFSAYSRRDEYEADRLGIKYMHLAGYDLNGMIRTLQVLEKESEKSRMPLILRSHPYVEDRIEAVKKEMEATVRQNPPPS